MKAVSSNPAPQEVSAGTTHQLSYKVPVLTDSTTANTAKLIGVGTLSAVIVIFVKTFATVMLRNDRDNRREEARRGLK
jgi:hypothetical protein